MLADLLPVMRVPYYRFNPIVPNMRLDETRPQVLQELQAIGRAHVTTGQGKADCESLAQLLTTGRGRVGTPARRPRQPAAQPPRLARRAAAAARDEHRRPCRGRARPAAEQAVSSWRLGPAPR